MLKWASLEKDSDNEKPKRIQQYGYKIIENSKNERVPI
jgi:hypothetical protein